MALLDKTPKLSPPTLTITINDIDVRRYTKKFGRSRASMDVALRTFARAVYGEVVRRTPGQNIKNQWRIVYTSGGSILGRHITNIKIINDPANTDVIFYLERGTVPHQIFAVNYDFMRFYWPAVQKWVFARTVYHPGTKPYKMLAGAVAYIEQQASKTTNSMENKFGKTLNG